MAETLWTSIQTLAPLEPRFVSVTYGAGGSTRERTHATVERILKETSLTPAAHLTCVAAARDEIDAIARDYWELGVRHIVALRGDAPEAGAEVSAASAGLSRCRRTRRRAEAGGAIRRYRWRPIRKFIRIHRRGPSTWKISSGRWTLAQTAPSPNSSFRADCFFRFQDEVAAAGIEIEIVPGILPVSNVAQTRRFAHMCGACNPGLAERDSLKASTHYRRRGSSLRRR